MGSKHKHGHIAATSCSSNNVSELCDGSFDLAVFTSSWDRRCVSVCNASALQYQYGILVLFDTRDKSGLRDTHDPKLLEYLNNRKARKIFQIRGRSLDVDTIWKSLRNKMTWYIVK